MYERENKDICRKMDNLDKVRGLKINKGRRREGDRLQKNAKKINKTESR